jgi:hypothetical protein
MTYRDREGKAVYAEAANEAFAGFLGILRDRKLNPVPPSAFDEVRSAFKIAFLMGVIWQRRKDKAAGRQPG